HFCITCAELVFQKTLRGYTGHVLYNIREPSTGRLRYHQREYHGDRRMRLYLLAAAAVLSGSLRAADPGLLSLVPAETRVLAGVSVDKLASAPIGQYLLALIDREPDPQLQKIIENTGFDPRRDLHEVLVAASGAPNGAPLILGRGTFDIPRII